MDKLDLSKMTTVHWGFEAKAAFYNPQDALTYAASIRKRSGKTLICITFPTPVTSIDFPYEED